MCYISGRGEACYECRDDLYKALDILQGTEINGKPIKLTIKVRVPNFSVCTFCKARVRNRNYGPISLPIAIFGFRRRNYADYGVKIYLFE